MAGTRQVVIHDVVFIERRVTLPEACPHCRADFTEGSNLNEWDWNDSKVAGKLVSVPDESGTFEGAGYTEVGDTYRACDYWCGACGRQVVDGGAVVDVAEADVPKVLTLDMASRLDEARGVPEEPPPVGLTGPAAYVKGARRTDCVECGGKAWEVFTTGSGEEIEGCGYVRRTA